MPASDDHDHHDRPYHHGDLRRAVLDATVEVIAEVGPTGFSLREVARRAGVSHAAPAHHFGDRTGLLTAFATEGYRMLGAELDAASTGSNGDLLEVGVAYVRFAVAHRPHFEVMFRRDLLDLDDPDLLGAIRAANAPLLHSLAAALAERGVEDGAEGIVEADLDVEALAIGAWAQMHGLAALWTSGNLPAHLTDPEHLARRVSAALDAAASISPEDRPAPTAARRRTTRSARGSGPTPRSTRPAQR